MLFFEGSTFANFLANAFAVFAIVLWLWLFVAIATDLFRRSDISGPGKALWVILFIVLPYIGVFAYILTQSRGMAERDEARARQQRDELRGIAGVSVADELVKLNRLKTQKAISEEEYLTLRQRLVA